MKVPLNHLNYNPKKFISTANATEQSQQFWNSFIPPFLNKLVKSSLEKKINTSFFKVRNQYDIQTFSLKQEKSLCNIQCHWEEHQRRKKVAGPPFRLSSWLAGTGVILQKQQKPLRPYCCAKSCHWFYFVRVDRHIYDQRCQCYSISSTQVHAFTPRTGCWVEFPF